MEVADQFDWKLILPPAVRIEAVKRRPLDQEIIDAINEGMIIEIPPVPSTYQFLLATHGNLGLGELESIALVVDCVDKTYNQYLILSEDYAAANHAEKLGMTFMGILPLLSIANSAGLLSRELALNYLARLRKNDFTPSMEYTQDFIDSLV